MKKITKTLIFAGAFAVLATACNKDDKAAKLEKLKAELEEQVTSRDKIEKSIDELRLKIEEVEGKKDKTKVSLVQVEVLENKSFLHYLDIQGKVDSDNNVMVSAKMGGTLTRVYVKEGDHVSKGQLLATIDAAQIEKGVAEIKSSLSLAEDVYNRQKALWDQKIGTEVQYLQAKNNKEALESKLQTIYAQLDQSRIKATISGTVDQVLYNEGEAVAPGPVFRVVNLSAFKVVAEVPETYSSKVNQGDKAEIEFNDIGKQLKSRLTTVGNVINPVTRTFPVEVRLGNAGFALKPNMTAKIRINDYSNANAIVVPINTVQIGAKGEKFVYVANSSDKAERKPVEVGMTYGSDAEILKGLKAGDKIVSVGYLDLEDGQTLKY